MAKIKSGTALLPKIGNLEPYLVVDSKSPPDYNVASSPKGVTPVALDYSSGDSLILAAARVHK